MKIIDVARKAVELADADPEFVYQPQRDDDGYYSGGCKYVHREEDGTPIKGEGCLFGQALVSLGVDPESFSEGVHVGVVLSDLGLDSADKSDELLLNEMEQAQSRQDTKEPWGEAVRTLRALVATIDAGAAA